MEEKKYKYVNEVAIVATCYDFLLTLNTKGMIDGKPVELEPSLFVSMSPQHAKAFSDLLADQIKMYEKNFGQIDIVGKKLDNPEK